MIKVLDLSRYHSQLYIERKQELSSIYLLDLQNAVQNFYLGTDSLNPGIGDGRDVASSIISREQAQSNRVRCFQTLDTVFPMDLFSDYLEITTAVAVPCDGPKMSSRSSIYTLSVKASKLLFHE